SAACASNGATIATVAPGTTPGTFTVTPALAGSCTFTVTGDGGQTAEVPVEVTPGPVSVNPPSLIFPALGESQTITAGQNPGNGTFSSPAACTSGGTTIATVTQG